MDEKERLHAWLLERGVDTTAWGTGAAKTLDHLLIEVQTKEAMLTVKDSRVVRAAVGTVVNVFHDDERLIEEKQVFKDGRVKHRTLEASIGEKMGPDEEPWEAAYRALKEELGITRQLPLIAREAITKGPVESHSYPGLLTFYMMHVFDVHLPDDLYDPEGYIERQEDKTSYFVWRRPT